MSFNELVAVQLDLRVRGVCYNNFIRHYQQLCPMDFFLFLCVSHSQFYQVIIICVPQLLLFALFFLDSFPVNTSENNEQQLRAYTQSAFHAFNKHSRKKKIIQMFFIRCALRVSDREREI